jgi:hypothetical protein
MKIITGFVSPFLSEATDVPTKTINLAKGQGDILQAEKTTDFNSKFNL